MDKILQEVKKLITKNYPANRTLNGSEFERGRQSICIELADIFDPVNNENSKPEFIIEPGEVIFKQKVVAKALAGWHNINTTFTGNGVQISTDMPYDNQLEAMTFEVIIRKAADKKNQEQPQDFEEDLKAIEEPPKPKKRRKVAVDNGIIAQIQEEYERAQEARNNDQARANMQFWWDMANAQAR